MEGFDPLPYWERLAIDALALYGRDDTNVPSADSVAILLALENEHIQVREYEGSGHALADPEDQGDSIFREDALDDIRDFIRSVSDRP